MSRARRKKTHSHKPKKQGATGRRKRSRNVAQILQSKRDGGRGAR